MDRREFLRLTTGGMLVGLAAAALEACGAKPTATVPSTDAATATKTATVPSTDAATATKTATITKTKTATPTSTATPTETARPTETPAPEVGRFNVEGILTYSDAYSRVEIDSGTGYFFSINIPNELMVKTRHLFDKIDYPAGFVTMMGKIQLYEMMKAQFVLSKGSMYPEIADQEIVPLAERLAYVNNQLTLGPIKVDFETDAKIVFRNGKVYDGGKGKLRGDIHGVDMVFVPTLDELWALRDKLGRDPDVSVFIGDMKLILYLERGRLIQIMVAPETGPDSWGYTQVKFSDYDKIPRTKSGVVTDLIRLLGMGVENIQWLVGSKEREVYWPWKSYSGYNLILNEQIVGTPGCSLSSNPSGCGSFYDRVFVS